jgi:competence protein ComEA
MISDFGKGNSEFIRKLKVASKNVIPAKAGIQKLLTSLNSRMRGSDKLITIRGSLKGFFALLIPRSALRIPHFSIGQQRVLFLLALLILALTYYKFYYRPPFSPEEVYKEVVIEVLGEVQKPGIYIFKNPPTMKEAIVKAGGLMENTSLEQLSSSEILETGTQLELSRESSTEIRIKLGRMEARKLLAFSIPLDLNRASAEDLCLVPGIGESLAREIVTYRERRKRFQSVDELRNVKGIGEKKWKDFREFFTVR